jgi:acyl carrier protein
MSIRLTIIDQMAQVAREQGKTLAPLNDDLVLLDSGLDSLGVAVLIARLEDRLGIDPFSKCEDIQLPVTIGDFVKAYENDAR